MNSLLLEAESLIGQSKEADACIVLMRALETNEEDHQARLMLARVLYGLGLRVFSGDQLASLCTFFPENKRLKRLHDLITGKALDASKGGESEEEVEPREISERADTKSQGDVEVEVEFDADFF